VKNLGYFIVKDVYKRFKMDEVKNVVTYNKNFKFDFESVFRFLVFSQIVNPGSKQQEFKLIHQFFDDFSFSEDQMCDAILLIGQKEELLKEYILLRLKEIVTLNTKHTFFDGTNIYFEIDRENEELKRGPEKNGRHDPILGMGLLMDGNGIPLNYSIFPGNASEQPELHKNVQSMKKKLDITGRTIITADKGLNSGDNMYKAIQNGDGYVMGQKVRGSSKECISWILQDDERDPYETYKDSNNTIVYKVKSEEGDYPVTITSPLNGQKTTINLHQKRIVFWSKDYADKAAFEREKIIAKANQIIANPKAYLKSSVGDAANYIKEIKYDKNGEIIESAGFILDKDAIEKAKALDGYYMIVTSETMLDNSKIIEIYRGLWEIEETFSIFKGVLKVRPVFAKSLVGIHCHILICFMSLLILRLLQKKFLRKELTKEQVNAIMEANKKKRNIKLSIKKSLNIQ
jgi:Transposase